VLDGQPFGGYQKLLNKAYYTDRYRIRFVHLQGSPGAFPASVCRIRLKIAELGLAKWCLASVPRKMATADYLLRAFHAGVIHHARQNRGARGSGSFQPLLLPPQVLERNLVGFTKTDVQITCRINLPGSRENRVLGRQAIRMFTNEMPKIVDSLIESVA
jgi:predicted ABC-class ATPase